MNSTKIDLTRLNQLCQVSSTQLKPLKGILSSNINTLGLATLELSNTQDSSICQVLNHCFCHESQGTIDPDLFIGLSHPSLLLREINLIIMRNIFTRIEKNSLNNQCTLADFSVFYAKVLLDKEEYEDALYYAKKAILLYQNDILEDKSNCLDDFIFALQILSHIEHCKGEFSLSLNTGDDIFSLFKQPPWQLKQTKQSLYYETTVIYLNNLIALELYEEAEIRVDDLIDSNPDPDDFNDNTPYFATFFFTRSSLFQRKEAIQPAINDALQACKLFRSFAFQTLDQQLEYANCLNELCALQYSLHYIEQALYTIKQSLTLYEQLEVPFSEEMLSGHITALLHYIGLSIEHTAQEFIIDKLDSLLFLEGQQIKLLKRNNLTPDLELLTKLQQTELLLGVVGDHPALDALYVKLNHLKA
ncbi:MAG: hypothetical protein KAG28_03375 [Cocleimonas sp.]|nr:hypothetical protein [Cocleimonas sp.]